MDNAVEVILQEVDLVEVVGEYVSLKKAGKNYKGLCPFHQEKTPSFSVSPEKNLYYCFGCGAGGNVFNFLMELENIPFKEALEMLARRQGIELESRDPAREKAHRRKKDLMFELYRLVARFYQYILLETKAGSEARDYLEKRGYPLDWSQKVGLGLAPRGWDNLLKFLEKKGYQPAFLEEAGLVIKGRKGYYDRFRDRLMFTIFNRRNHPIAFGGRLLSDVKDQPKYLNSPETLLYSKSRNLYGINWAAEVIREQDSVLVVEGYTDVLSLHLHGMENSVASLGTALTLDQARLLKRFASRVYIAYDSDIAGESATRRGLEILRQEGLKVFIVELEEGMDPDDVVREQGLDFFSEKVKTSKNYLEYLLDRACEKFDLDSSSGRIEAGQECVRVLGNIDNEIERQVYLKYAAEKLDLEAGGLERELNKLLKGRKKENEERGYRTIKKQVGSSALEIFEEKILSRLLAGDEEQEFFSRIEPEDFVGPKHFELAQLIAAGKTVSELQLGEDPEIVELVNRLRFNEVQGSTDELVERFLVEKFNQQKRNIREEIKSKSVLPLFWINNKLLEYRDILEKERGLRKEG